MDPTELEKLISCSTKEFSTAKYLNYALQNSSSLPSSQETSGDELSQRLMAELALSLQMQTQSCHDEIGRIGAELRAIVPRCSADLSRLKLGIENLRDDAKTLLETNIARRKSYAAGQEDHGDSLGDRNSKQGEASRDHDHGGHSREKESLDHKGNNTSTLSEKDLNMDPDADDDDDDDDDDNDDNDNDDDDAILPSSSSLTHTAALETLSTLHALKHNLNSAKQVLVAASTYNQTLAKIPSLLNPSMIHQCVQAWMDLEQGAKALGGMPGKTQRREEIQKIRQEILTLLKPVLLHALSKVDSRLGPLQTCVSLYQSLGETSSLMDEYVKIRPSSVHKLWFDYRKLQVDKRDSDHDEKLEGIVAVPEEEEKENDDLLEADPSMTFITWLPTWYDAILVLLSEERRRAHAVFGAELAPEVMVKVLNECFRPISSSFEKRLATLSHSFDAICRAYASTLQFLSVAYEQMVDFDNNTSSSMNAAVEGGVYDASSGHKNPVQLHFMALDTFVAIASPFAVYQRTFATLESNFSGILTRELSTDLHKAVSGRILNSSDMEESVVKLTSLAASIFPLVQGSLARFELMNCGFEVSDGLDTIDKILSAHFGELSIAFHTLLTNALSIQKSSDSNFSNGFDEQQIHCALDVLKIAGDMRNNLNTFHAKVRGRLHLLSGRIEASVEQRMVLSKALKERSFHSTPVPDSLSVADIEILIAAIIQGDSDNVNTQSSISTLHMLSNVEEDFDNGLFPKALESLKRLIKSSQLFVFDICAAVPLQFLNEMHSLPVWSKQDNLLSNITSNSYGTLPQSYITQVGEHLLALVQALEPFASDKNALNVAKSVMGGLEYVNMKHWTNFAHALSPGHEDDDFIHMLRRGENMKNLILNSIENEIEDEEDTLDENELEAQQFSNQWLDVICSSVTGVLLENIMRIEHLSAKGCEHCCTDLNYIVNVLTALGVSGHPHPLLVHVLELIQLGTEELESHIVNIPDDVYCLRNIQTRLVQMRRNTN